MPTEAQQTTAAGKAHEFVSQREKQGMLPAQIRAEADSYHTTASNRAHQTPTPGNIHALYEAEVVKAGADAGDIENPVGKHKFQSAVEGKLPTGVSSASSVLERSAGGSKIAARIAGGIKLFSHTLGIAGVVPEGIELGSKIAKANELRKSGVLSAEAFSEYSGIAVADSGIKTVTLGQSSDYTAEKFKAFADKHNLSQEVRDTLNPDGPAKESVGPVASNDIKISPEVGQMAQMAAAPANRAGIGEGRNVSETSRTQTGQRRSDERSLA